MKLEMEFGKEIYENILPEVHYGAHTNGSEANEFILEEL